MPGNPTRLLLVAGAGRSGTSLFTSLAGRLGVTIPGPEVKADDSNPEGFGEPRWAVDFHNRLLQRVNVGPEDGRPEAWDIAAKIAEEPDVRAELGAWLSEHCGTADRVVVKDPRLTWFLDLYLRVAEEISVEVSVATLVRHPAASVYSRQLAYGTKATPTTRTASWLNMMLGVEQRTRSLPRAFVPYDLLLADWEATLRKAESHLSVPLVSGASPEQLTRAGELVDVSLRRAEASWADLGLSEALEGMAERCYEGLRALHTDAHAAGTLATLDTGRSEYDQVFEAAAELTRSRVRAARVEERRKRNAEARQAATQPASRRAALRTLLMRRPRG